MVKHGRSCGILASRRAMAMDELKQVDRAKMLLSSKQAVSATAAAGEEEECEDNDTDDDSDVGIETGLRKDRQMSILAA